MAAIGDKQALCCSCFVPQAYLLLFMVIRRADNLALRCSLLRHRLRSCTLELHTRGPLELHTEAAYQSSTGATYCREQPAQFQDPKNRDFWGQQTPKQSVLDITTRNQQYMLYTFCKMFEFSTNSQSRTPKDMQSTTLRYTHA